MRKSIHNTKSILIYPSCAEADNGAAKTLLSILIAIVGKLSAAICFRYIKEMTELGSDMCVSAERGEIVMLIKKVALPAMLFLFHRFDVLLSFI